MSIEEILIQISGYLGLILVIIAFQLNDRKKMLFFQMAAGFAFTIHYILMSEQIGAILNALIIVRNIIFSYKQEKAWASSILWMFGFIALYLAIGIITWDNIFYFLPSIGVSCGTIAFWMDNPSRIRLLSLVGPVVWTFYNYIVGSTPGVLTTIFIMGSIITGIVRFDILKQKETK